MVWRNRVDVPDDVRLSFLKELYRRRPNMWVGAIAHVAICMLVFSRTNDPAFLWFSAGFVVLAVAKFIDTSLFERTNHDNLAPDKIVLWERRYLLGSILLSSSLGMVCFYSTYILRDPFAEFATLIMFFSSVVFIASNNYASPIIVISMSIFGTVPVIIGFFLIATPLHIVIGLLLIPYMLLNIGMAKELWSFLFDAVLGKKTLSEVVGRFNAALNTMPQGLLLFDANSRVVVINKMARSMLGLKELRRLQGRNINTLLRYCTARGMFPGNDYASVSLRFADIVNGRRKRDIFAFNDGRYIECIGNPGEHGGAVLMFEDVTQRMEAEARIQFMARHDTLTGMPNRSYFESIVRAFRAHRTETGLVALIVLDILHFKTVNDLLGHAAGDRLLCLFAKKLRSLDPSLFIASRFGSDEFVIFVSYLESHEALPAIMEQILETVVGEYQIDGTIIPIDVCAGVAIADGLQSNLADMHVKADIALNEVKDADDPFQQRWTLFRDVMNIRYRGRQQLKNELPIAINEGQLRVVYQPIVNLATQKIIGCEALSRWEHPERGTISPLDYIPLAEEMGIISEITAFMLQQACWDCAAWGKSIGVSVNLSAYDLKNDRILSTIKEALQESRIPANLLEVEVTESAIIRDSQRASRVLQELRNWDLNVALDDFGTGYSSLSYLNQLPLSKVKVDRSFARDIVTDRRSLMLLRGVTHLSHELGLGVTVEGIETEEQLALVQSVAEANFAQGYLWGKPMPAQRIRALLEQQANAHESA